MVAMGRQADFITIVGSGDMRLVRPQTKPDGTVALKKQAQGLHTRLDVVNYVNVIHQILAIVVVDQLPRVFPK